MTIEEQLRKHGFRATSIRKAALESLSKTQVAVSIQELFDSLIANPKVTNPDWTTVYRILTQFESAGLVFSFEMNGIKKFEYTHEASNSHHHHLICRDCQRIEHLKSCESETLLNMTAPFNFKDVSHKLEFYGLCPDCAL